MRNPWPFPLNLVWLIAIGPPRRPALSPRDAQLVRLAALGCTPPEVASLLGRSVADVQHALDRLEKDLGVSDLPLQGRRDWQRLLPPIDGQLTVVERLFLQRHRGELL